MERWSLSPDDLAYLSNHGIDEETFRKYQSIFQKGKQPPKLVRPCTCSDGIEVLSEKEQESFISIYEEEAAKGRCSKFVPASGAATRMFQCLCPIFAKDEINTIHDLEKQAEKRSELKEALTLFLNIHRLPFFPELDRWCRTHGYTVEELITKGPIKHLVHGILRRDGLGLGTLPKALIPFHRYGEEVRTPFEEHILEAAGFVKDREGRCRIHFTVPNEHLSRFQDCAKTMAEKLGKEGIKLDISFSIQHPSTHTPAVDEKGNLLRTPEGNIILRPGGHGALLKNLQEYGGDIVFIKNVDNIAEDSLKPLVVRWKKILGGMLVALERDFHEALERLDKDPNFVNEAEEIYLRWKQTFPFRYERLTKAEKLKALKFLLDRPKRICGMVRNVDEPGGGPFWVMDQDGWITRQIVEQAQINFSDEENIELWKASTHFNPVDVVCALKDRRGNSYNLSLFVDYNSYIITEKLHHGTIARVLEHPGLWNGSMAYWITVFVEVPRETFYPVKKITDLLGKQTTSK